MKQVLPGGTSIPPLALLAADVDVGVGAAVVVVDEEEADEAVQALRITHLQLQKRLSKNTSKLRRTGENAMPSNPRLTAIMRASMHTPHRKSLVRSPRMLRCTTECRLTGCPLRPDTNMSSLPRL